MRYTSEQIEKNILAFMEDTNQYEIVHVIAYCLGYYGYITNQIWNVILDLKYKKGRIDPQDPHGNV